MGIFNRFPYSSTHEMNLDFMLGKAQEINEQLQTVQTGMQEVQTGLSQISEQTERATTAAAAAEAARDESQQNERDAFAWTEQAEQHADRAEAALSQMTDDADRAEAAADRAEAAAQNASISASAASNSANIASQNSATAAQQAANAELAAQNAANALNRATVSANNAQNSAVSAADAAALASGYNSQAATSATNAATSATNAASSATSVIGIEQRVQNLVESIPEDYTTLSNDVDGLKSAITFFGGGTPITLKWNYGYIRASDMAIVVDGGSTHVYSDCVLIPAKTMLYLPRVNKSTSVVMLALCDSNGTPTQRLLIGTSTANSTHEHIIYPFVEDTYVRITGNMSESDYMKYYAKPMVDDVCFDDSTFALFNSTKEPSYTSDRMINTSGTLTIATGMMASGKICLPKGMTLEYWGCGSGVTSPSTVSLYPATGNTVPENPSVVDGTIYVQHGEYTATDHVYVRLSARVAPDDSDFNAVIPEEKFKGWRIYYKPTHFPEHIKNSKLYQKKLTIMGDSLAYGNQLGTGVTWTTSVGLKYNMTVINLGINGCAIAGNSSDSMVNRLDAIPADTDIFILEGGANDKNDNIPIGDINSSDTTTFCGAINHIINTVRQNCPKARIGMLTNWQRYRTINSIGNTDEDYVNAMVAVAHNLSVPVIDNYHGCGLTFFDNNLLAWIDEAKDRQKIVDGNITYYNDGKTAHFSLSAYEWLEPLYEQFLLNMRSNGDGGIRHRLEEIENYLIRSSATRLTTFEQGTISSSGVEQTNNNYVRSGYLTEDNFIRMDKPTGIRVLPCLYTDDQAFIVRLDYTADYTTSIKWSDFVTRSPAVKYVRFVATINGTTTTPADIVSSGLNIWTT